MEKFWKLFDKGGTIAFWILGPLVGLIILVVWLFQPSDADINAAIEDVTKSEQVYSMAVINYTERQLNGIDGEEPTPCEIYHKIVYYIDKKLLDPSSLSNGQMVYDFKSFGCSQTEAPKKYRIKKKEKSVKEVKTKPESQPAPQVQQLAKPKGNTSEAACAAFSRASLELRNGVIDRETFNYLKDEYNWDENGCANQADDDANYMKEKLRKAKAKWRGEEEQSVQPIVRESADYKKQKEEQARLEAMQAENRRLAEENRRLAEERAKLEEERLNQAQFIEIPKNEAVDETAPVRQGDCSDPTLLKYTNMYDNGLMSRIEYQDFVYSNGFDKCF